MELGPHVRSTFREHPLEGAMLYFHPATGTQVHVRAPSTRRLVRRSPRVVMFGITNACNLSCGFCSRDPSRKSRWTVASAAEVLEGLHAAGCLEVAFGGGEPFAFRGFDALLSRLHATTGLALHVTTNGTLLSDEVLARLRGVIGQVRLSIYDGQPWRESAERLARAGQLWGANILVDEAILGGLPALLGALADLGADDVSLLSYVGPDPHRRLSTEGEAVLATIVRASPVRCRISVCFGDRLPLPRLFDGANASGDCGAGLDFVTVTPDKRLQSCSFQDSSWEIASAEDVLRTWEVRRAALSAASSRQGCARDVQRSASVPADGIRIWRAFAGNNSGECVLVAKFESTEDAERMLADLVPGYVPGERYSAPWKELFEREGLSGPHLGDGVAPDEMLAHGRAFIARTVSAAGDDFPELRALAWKRGGEVIPGGIHEHEPSSALFVIQGRDAADAGAVASRANTESTLAIQHGDRVVGRLSRPARTPGVVPPESDWLFLGWARDALAVVAEDRPVALEIVNDVVDRHALEGVLKRLGAPSQRVGRLQFQFWGSEPAENEKNAVAFASKIDGEVTQVNGLVLVDRLTRKKRLAVLGYRQGANVLPLEGEEVAVGATYSRNSPPRTKGQKTPAPPRIEVERLRQALDERIRRELGGAPYAIEVTSEDNSGRWVFLTVKTTSPSPVLRVHEELARAEGLLVHVGVRDLDLLDSAVRRLLADVQALARAAPWRGGRSTA